MDFAEKYQKDMTALENDDKAAKKNGKLVGRYLTHSVADGYAYYKIVKQNTTTVRIEHVDIGDGYTVLAWGRAATIPTSKAEAILRQRDWIANAFHKTEDWWENRKIGEVVHYSYGFNQYVRGVIVAEDNEKKMKPTALVGAWRDYDVAVRKPDGSIRYGVYANKILNGETFQPNASNMVEYPEFKLQGTHPSRMPEIRLAAPEMTPEQKALSVIVKQHQRVTEALQYNRTGDPVADADAAFNAMVDALRVLRGTITN